MEIHSITTAGESASRGACGSGGNAASGSSANAASGLSTSMRSHVGSRSSFAASMVRSAAGRSNKSSEARRATESPNGGRTWALGDPVDRSETKQQRARQEVRSTRWRQGCANGQPNGRAGLNCSTVMAQGYEPDPTIPHSHSRRIGSRSMTPPDFHSVPAPESGIRPS